MAASIHIVVFWGYDTIQSGMWTPTFRRSRIASVFNVEAWISNLKGGGTMFNLLGGCQHIHLQG
jgi:hypothetical protein